MKTLFIFIAAVGINSLSAQITDTIGNPIRTGPGSPTGTIGPTGIISPTGVITPTGATGPTGTTGPTGLFSPSGVVAPTGKETTSKKINSGSAKITAMPYTSTKFSSEYPTIPALWKIGEDYYWNEFIHPKRKKAIVASTFSKRDKKFSDEAAEGNLMEVMLGELAKSNASSATVKKLGWQMSDDHSKAYKELKSLADKKNVTIPTALNEKEQKAYDKLVKIKGADFDKAYSKCMVKDHKKDLCEFKKEAKKGDDNDLKTWASATIPTLEHHEQMAKDACKSVKENK